MQKKRRKTVLVIAYYFPPMGSSGVQRPLKFVKYLQQFGWKPVVLAPEPGLYTHYDQSLLDELENIRPAVDVFRVKGNTPFDRAGSQKALGNLPDWLMEPARMISSFLYMPDNKKGWIKPAFEKAIELHKQHHFDAVFATAPPYSNLLLAAELKKETGLPVLMDFRDDWAASHLIKYPTPLHRRKMEQIEKECLLKADLVTAINGFMMESLKSRNSRSALSFEILQQGYDPEDVAERKITEDSSDKIRILYNGLFYGENQPDTFLKGVAALLDEKPEYRDRLELVFQGGLQKEHRTKISGLGLESLVEDTGYITHKKACEGLALADIVWFVVGHRSSAEQVTTGKLFEYIGSRKIILGLVPQKGEAACILDSLEAGFVADPYKPESVKNQLLYILLHLDDLKKRSKEDREYLGYSRVELTRKLAGFLDRISLNRSATINSGGIEQ